MSSLEPADLHREALARIVALTRHKTKQILQEIGTKAFDLFYDDGWQLTGSLTPEQRRALSPHADELAAATAYVTPARKIILQSPGLRSRTINVQSNDALLDLDFSLEAKEKS